MRKGTTPEDYKGYRFIHRNTSSLQLYVEETSQERAIHALERALYEMSTNSCGWDVVPSSTAFECIVEED